MAPRRIRALLLFAALPLAACGDLSNEDLQFMAVLPDQTLAVAVPSYSSQNQTPEVEVDAVALAASASIQINNVTAAIVKTVQTLRLLPPSRRSPGHRVWGPYSVSGEPGVYELVMNRVSNVSCSNPDDPIESGAVGYAWTIQGATTKDGVYVPLATGTVRGLDFSHSCGSITYESTALKALGGSLTNTEPTSFSVTWTRGPHATTLQTTVTPSPSGTGALVENTTYDFRSLPDGDGHFNFAERYAPSSEPATLHLLRAQLEWGTEGRPWRLDYEIESTTNAELSHGVSCGDILGDRTTKDFGTPSTTFDVASDPNCTYDYLAGS